VFFPRRLARCKLALRCRDPLECRSCHRTSRIAHPTSAIAHRASRIPHRPSHIAHRAQGQQAPPPATRFASRVPIYSQGALIGEKSAAVAPADAQFSPLNAQIVQVRPDSPQKRGQNVISRADCTHSADCAGFLLADPGSGASSGIANVVSGPREQTARGWDHSEP
jgi:hypothetical protein